MPNVPFVLWQDHQHPIGAPEKQCGSILLFQDSLNGGAQNRADKHVPWQEERGKRKGESLVSNEKNYRKKIKPITQSVQGKNLNKGGI